MTRMFTEIEKLRRAGAEVAESHAHESTLSVEDKLREPQTHTV